MIEALDEPEELLALPGSVEAANYARVVARAAEPWLAVCARCGDDVHRASLGGRWGDLCAACRLDDTLAETADRRAALKLPASNHPWEGS